VRAYPSVGDLPEAPDLAVVVVPAPRVAAVVEECGRKGVRAVVVVSAGFREIGPEGAARERELLAIVRRHGMRMVGPNCLGVLSREEAVRLDATFAPAWPPSGGVAFSSQSGALGLAILEYASEIGIGISQFVSVGNKADVSGNDLIEFWEQDPGTRVILLYLESFGNPRRFLEIARRVGRTKPILAVKSGRTLAGRRAASSHTGALAGPDTAVDALCAQAGVIRTDTIEELFDVAMVLANQPPPRGSRVAIVTNAGGPAIMAADACESHGLEVPPLADSTVAALREFLPPEASTRNPVDMIASANEASFERAVRLVATDPGIDSVLVIFVPPMVTAPAAVANAIVRGATAATAELATRGEGPKPVVSCFMGAHGVPAALRDGAIPSFAFPESAAIALSRAARWNRGRNEPAGSVPVLPGFDGKRAHAVVTRALAERGDGWLRPEEVSEVLTAIGLARPESVRARTAVEAVRAARHLGVPVALKVVSDAISHKSDVGGVILGLEGDDEVTEAFASIAHAVDGKAEGVLVQAMVNGGVDTLVGVARDPAYGPLVAFGLGGVDVELLGDVVFRLAPLTDRDARTMVRSIRAARRFDAWRGSPPSDVPAIEDALLRIGKLAEEVPEIAEMDLNPLRVGARGQGAVVLDARIAVRSGPPSSA
jgi:acyl-CoA synthetase (NDP forming)